MRLERKVGRDARRLVHEGRWRLKRRWATSIHGDDRRRSYELVGASVQDVSREGSREGEGRGILAVPDTVRVDVAACRATPEEGVAFSVERLGPVRRSLMHQRRSSCSHSCARSVLNPILFT